MSQQKEMKKKFETMSITKKGVDRKSRSMKIFTLSCCNRTPLHWIYNIKIPNISIQFHLSSFDTPFFIAFFPYFQCIQKWCVLHTLDDYNFVCDCIWFRFVAPCFNIISFYLHFNTIFVQYMIFAIDFIRFLYEWKLAGNELLRIPIRFVKIHTENARKLHRLEVNNEWFRWRKKWIKSIQTNKAHL